MLNGKKCFFTILLGICLLLAPNVLLASPHGKVVFVNYGLFEATGGDPLSGRGAGAKTIKALLHEGLTIKGPDGQIQPAIAKSWSIESNWRSINFILDERPTFHDGEPVTAEDVKFSLDRGMRKDMKFIFGGEMRRLIDRVEVQDKHNLTVYLKEPYPAFLARCAEYIPIVPKKYIEKIGDAEYARKPIGAGPFKFVAFEQDVFFEVQAFEQHYRKVPEIKTLLFKCVPEGMTRLAMLKTGEADIVSLDPEHILEVEKIKKFRIEWSQYAYMMTLAFDDLAFPEKSPFKDVRVRQAVSYALNREAICKNVLYGAAQPSGDIFAPYQIGYDPKIKSDPYDPEKAKALLKEAGYLNGFQTEITVDGKHRLSAQAVAADLAKIGIKAKVNVLEHGTWLSMMRAKKLRGLGFRTGPWWSGRVLPSVALGSHFGKGAYYAYYVPEELGKAIEEVSILTDRTEIEAKGKEISMIYRKNVHRINLWAFNIAFGLGPKIRYWKNVPGWIYPAKFEEITINE